jgi:rhodanese-related sulfurtransferase
MGKVSRQTMQFARWLLMATVLAAGVAHADGVAEIDVAGAAQLIQDKKVFVLDVREPSEYTAGHIAGSVLIPLGQVNARVEELAKVKDQPMLVVCGSGVRSARAIQMLTKQGFSHMRNIKGGMDAWRKAGLPISKS